MTQSVTHVCLVFLQTVLTESTRGLFPSCASSCGSFMRRPFDSSCAPCCCCFCCCCCCHLGASLWIRLACASRTERSRHTIPAIPAVSNETLYTWLHIHVNGTKLYLLPYGRHFFFKHPLGDRRLQWTRQFRVIDSSGSTLEKYICFPEWYSISIFWLSSHYCPIS